MPVCCAYGCNNRTGLYKTCAQKEFEQHTKITYHAIPKNPLRRNKWIKAIGRADWTPSKYSIICSVHFEDKYFDRTSHSSVRLRETAIPTIFKGFPDYLKNVKDVQRTAGAASDVASGSNMEILNLPSTSNVSEKKTTSVSRIRRIHPSKAALMSKLRVMKQKIRILEQTKRRRAKKIDNLTTNLNNLKEQKLLQDQKMDILKNISGPKS